MKNLPLLIGSLALTLVAVIAVSVIFTKKASAPVVPVDQTLLVSDTPHVKGKPDAKVTVVEFSDFQCPSCKAVQPLVDSMLSKYGDKIRFIYRHFPLRTLHIHAAEAARAAEAAEKQGAFWAYHDKLFAVQEEWASQKDPAQKFIDYARELKLNTDQFTKDLKDSSLDTRVTADERDGNTIGVNATPTFYINGTFADANQLDGSIATILEAK